MRLSAIPSTRHGAAILAHAAGADLKDIQEMLGHSSITITAENTAPKAESEVDDAEKLGPESVPNDADPLGENREINSLSAHAPLTQTAPDGESEAE
ncbi:hypothetical protein ACWF94_21140 [Streptomyces sp. NPDC055078]